MDIDIEEIRKQYKGLFEHSLELVFLYNMETKFIDANDLALEALGYKREDIKDLAFIDLLSDKEQLLKAYENFKEMLKTGNNSTRSEYKLRRKDGKFIYIETYGIPLTKEGKIFAILGVGAEITERKLAEQELKESEKKYRLLSDNINDIIWTTDLNLKTTYVSQSVSSILGYSVQEDIAMSIKDKFTPDSLKKIINIFKEQFKPKNINNPNFNPVYTIELNQYHKDGSIIPTEITANPLRDEAGIAFGLVGITRSIAERKEAEQKVKESEEKYRLIADNSKDVIWINDLNFNTTYISPAVEHLLGYTPEKHMTLPKTVIMTPDSMEKIQNTLKRALEDEKVKDMDPNRAYTLELEQIHKEGHSVFVEINASFLRDSEGMPIGILGLSRNITERKKNQEKLKESEEKYRLIAENSKDVIWTTDMNFNITYISPSIKQLLGYAPEIHINLPHSATMKPIYIKLMNKTIKRALKDEKLKGRDPNRAYSVEVEQIHEEGHSVFVEINASFLRDSQGIPVGILGISRNITERKQAEKKLKESEEKYHHLFENSTYSVLLLSLDGTFIDINSTTETLFGYKKEDLIGKNLLTASLFSSELTPIISRRLRLYGKGKKMTPIELQIFKKDGTLVWVNPQVSLIELGSEPVIQIILQDITEKKKAENIIKEELVKLKELDQIRKDLISRVSHELKTPLMTINATAEYILDFYREQFNEESLDLVAMIERGGKRLEKLVGRLLDISRIEYLKLELDKKKSDLSVIIRECSKDMLHLIKKRDIILKLDLLDNLNLEVDEIRIEQVITNLLSNAIKNTPPKGKIGIILRKNGNWAEISISDTGVGLTGEEIKKIFTRFGKIDRKESGLEYLDIRGSGLGLYISKEIVDLHNGEIWVKSEGRHKGCKFTVRLPIE